MFGLLGLCAAAFIVASSRTSNDAVVLREGEQPVVPAPAINLETPKPALAAPAGAPSQAAPVAAKPSDRPPDRVRVRRSRKSWTPERLARLADPDLPPPITGARTEPRPKGLRDYGSDEPPVTGNLLAVRSMPPGMRVEVGGILVGVTPVLRYLLKPAEELRVRVSGHGFKPVERTVRRDAKGEYHFSTNMLVSPPKS